MIINYINKSLTLNADPAQSVAMWPWAKDNLQSVVATDIMTREFAPCWLACGQGSNKYF